MDIGGIGDIGGVGDWILDIGERLLDIGYWWHIVYWILVKFSMITWQAVEEAVFDPTPPTEAKGEVQMNNNVELAMMMMMITTMMTMMIIMMTGEEEKRREETIAAFRSYLPNLLARFVIIIIIIAALFLS